jgi:PAS domain S-box-containing protein
LSNRLQNFYDEYASALRRYLVQREEAVLQQAYVLGRRALAEKVSLVEMVSIHQEALADSLKHPLTAAKERSLIQVADEFFRECVGPFEMTLRGFQESIAELQQINKTLEKRVMERTEAMKRTAERLQALFQASPLPVIELDSDGRVLMWNPAAESVFGWTQEEVLGLPNPIIPAEHQKDSLLLRERALRGERFALLETTRQRKDGTLIPVSFSLAPLYDSEGKGLGVVMVIADITERKRMEEALRQSEARRRVAEAVESERRRLYDVMETLPAMICLLTPDYHVAFANRSFREKFGESGGRHCYEYCFGRAEPCEFCESYKVLETGKPHHWEVTTPDGSSVIDVYDFPFTDADGSTLILEMDIDITERKRADEALKEAHERIRFFASQCLTAQETERRRIAGELHDGLGGSLLGIKMAVERKLSDIQKGKSSSGSTTLEEILELVRNCMRDSSRIQHNLRPSALDHLGIAAALRSLCREFENAHEGIHTACSLGIEEMDVPEELKIILYRISQEALTNVAKHSKAENVSLSLTNHKGNVHLVVQDDGRGFDVKEALGSDKLPGGIGLDSMKERCELSGGTFSIDSKKGEGVTVRCNWSLNT